MHHLAGRGFMWMSAWPMAMFGFLFIIALVALVVWAARTSGPAARPMAPSVAPRSSALDILEERYARGEIDHDDFQQRRAALAGSGPTA